jgi:hypothetical protein
VGDRYPQLDIFRQAFLPLFRPGFGY